MSRKSGDVKSIRKVSLSDKPRRNSTVELRSMNAGDNKVSVLWDRNAEDYFVVGKDEIYIWESLTGQASLADIAEKFNLEVGEIDAEEVSSFVQDLVERGLAIIEGQIVEKKKRKDWFIEVFAIDIDRFLELPFFNVLGKIKPKHVYLGFLFLMSFVIIFFHSDLATLISSPSTYSLMDSTIIGWFFYMYVITIPTSIIHELSHAFACKICDIPPGKIGFGVLYLNTVFFTTASELMFAKKNQRIFVQIAGILGNLVTGALALFVFHFFGNEPYNIFSMFAFFSLLMGLANLFPFLRSDGYYMLTDLFDTPTLGPDTWQYLLHLIRVRKQSNFELPIKKKIIIIYLVLGFSLLLPLIVTNTMWILQILWGPDGFLKVILSKEPIPNSTMIGMVYLCGILAIFIIQLWNRHRR
jgi:hypothetical protein